MNSNVIEIQKLVADWAKAIRAADMDGILAHYTPDIVMFDVPVLLQSVGIDAYKKTWDVFFPIRRSGLFRVSKLKKSKQAKRLLFAMRSCE